MISQKFQKKFDHNLPIGWDKCNDWVLGGISSQIYVGYLLVGGELSLMTHFFIQYIPLFMIVIYWWISGIEWLKCCEKIHWKVSLFCEKVFFSTYFCVFHCILPVPTPQYTIILLLLSNIMLRCCWYTCTEHLTSRYVKKIHWVFLVLDFHYFSTHRWHFSMYSSRSYPAIHCLTHATHLYLSHWTCNHTWISSNNVIFCMSCYYYNFLLIISYLAQISGFWVTCRVKMMWLCHGWGW
jgi:hypothetical protein